MGVRAIQAKLLCDDRGILEHLWRTHRVFNERLPKVISALLEMRHGRCGDTQALRGRMSAFGNALLKLNAQNAYDVFIKAASGSARNTTAKALMTANGGAEAAAALDDFVNGFRPLEPAKASLSDLPNTLERKAIEESVAVIRSHLGLCNLWRSEHEAWLRKKAEWEAKHPEYMKLRARFEQGERERAEVTGKSHRFAKRAERDHAYLDWLERNPDLAEWRGQAKGIVPLDEAAKARIAKAKPWKQATKRAEEFWKLNPELHELHKLHVAYEREFVRRRRNRNNKWVRGFKLRPTFTLPDPVKHPRWLVFNAPQTSPQGYRDLSLPRRADDIGTVELLLLTGDKQNGDYPRKWVRVRFKGDPRLADFRPCKVADVFRTGKNKGTAKEKEAFEFLDRQINAVRPAQISGVKLIFKRVRLNDDGGLRSAVPYLVFTCNIDDVPATEAAKRIKWVEGDAIAKSGRRRKTITVPDGLVACAVDFGVRNLGFATLAEYRDGQPRVLRSRNIWLAHEEKEGAHPGRWSLGPDLAHLARHKRHIRRLRQMRGRPVHGEESHVELQDHITHMAEDRFKKGARAIINFALNAAGEKNKSGVSFPRADVLVIESLGGLLPDAERERGINRSLIEFNRGHLVDRIREMAQDVGLRVLTVNPVGTSQVCSRCGALGRRYSIRGNPDTRLPDIHFGPVEKLFACRCGYRSNSDHNASMNLHRRLCMGDKAVAAFNEFREKTDIERRQILEVLEGELLPQLRRLHGLRAAALDAEIPF
ncbi:MAG: zinc ribbon domain-containing protein [Terriglobales bacterium]